MDNTDKIRRLAHVARCYYIENRRQEDIAKDLGVSRPLISRMLSEAKDLGIVEIIIHDPDENKNKLLGKLTEKYSLVDAVLVSEGIDDKATNQLLTISTFDLMRSLDSKNIGIGWGHFIGQMVDYAERTPELNLNVRNIYPLMGNAGVAIRNYHSNENVRILSTALGAEPQFLSLPAIAENLEEKNILCSTETYYQIERQWGQMDTAFVNIGNYPSTPDFASVARYGQLLQKKKACGRMLAYFFNLNGEIIESDQDFVIQIPLTILKKCKNIVGLCSANTNLQALKGALNTGILTHIVFREELAKELLIQ